jgi:hypothetical protein
MDENSSAARTDALNEEMDDGAEDALESFNIQLFPVGDEDSAYRMKNDPKQPFQRDTVHQQTGSVSIRCNLVDVVHGRLTPDGKSHASLIVLHFRFDPRKQGRRVAEAHIWVEFEDMQPDGRSHPELAAIAPDGRNILEQTTQSEETTRGAEGTLGVSALQGAEMGAALRCEKKIIADVTHATSVIGSTELRGYQWGRDNTAYWTLLENPSRKTGVPASLRAAMLVERKRKSKFKCTVTIKSQLDFKSEVGQFFGKKELEDPVLFNPRFPPKWANKLKYDVDSLGTLDLELISDITFTTLRTDGIKQRGESRT